MNLLQQFDFWHDINVGFFQYILTWLNLRVRPYIVLTYMCHAVAGLRAEKQGQCSWKPLKKQCGVLSSSFTAEADKSAVDASAESAAPEPTPDSPDDKPKEDVVEPSPPAPVEPSAEEKTDDEGIVSTKTSVESLKETNENNSNNADVSQKRGWYLKFVPYKFSLPLLVVSDMLIISQTSSTTAVSCATTAEFVEFTVDSYGDSSFAVFVCQFQLTAARVISTHPLVNRVIKKENLAIEQNGKLTCPYGSYWSLYPLHTGRKTTPS